MALSGLGRVETASGNLGRAEQWLAEARDMFRRAGDRWGLTGALWNSADLAIARADLDNAQHWLEDALTLQAGKGRDRWHAECLARLADTALNRDDTGRAARLLTEARDRFLAGHDELGAADVDQRLRALAVPGQRAEAGGQTAV
jgi:hypothetical protein